MASLVSQLPFENYSLLRALSAHLIRVVQNAAVNKMTVRNLGIVFSPTLGVPAGVFTLMLNDFKRVFSVDDTVNDTGEQPAAGSSRRNSRNYEESAADRLLGLSGRSLAGEHTCFLAGLTSNCALARNEGQSSDTEEDISIHGESESGTDDVLEGDPNTGASEENSALRTPPRRSGSNDDGALRTPRGGRAANVAAERGLHISTDKQTRRQSRHIGLPRSPRPPQQQPSTPRSGQISGSFPNTPR
jgi:RalA-binding protein 1